MDRVSEWESMCNPESGCKTKCCFYNGSPCENLDIYKTELSAGRCRIYESRFGIRKNLKGEEFQCVPMHAYLLLKKAPELCGYGDITSVNGKTTQRGKELSGRSITV